MTWRECRQLTRRQSVCRAAGGWRMSSTGCWQWAVLPALCPALIVGCGAAGYHSWRGKPPTSTCPALAAGFAQIVGILFLGHRIPAADVSAIS